mmetsp:Transcript_132778/g.187502  ORF Transcript_132778/g.187502 Transcript_132778/m.187502 type:complete len:200 (-) Transcript_132778:323-922(-)
MPEQPADNLISLRMCPALVGLFFKHCLQLAHTTLQLFDLLLQALGALSNLALQCSDLLPQLLNALFPLTDSFLHRCSLSFCILHNAVCRVALSCELVVDGLCLRGLVLGSPHVLQLSVVTLLCSREFCINLVQLVHHFQSRRVQSLHVLLHASDDYHLRLFIPAEVDHAAQQRSKPLRHGIPEVLEIKVVHQIDHCKLP